jgi:hypothetical protein
MSSCPPVYVLFAVAFESTSPLLPPLLMQSTPSCSSTYLTNCPLTFFQRLKPSDRCLSVPCSEHHAHYKSREKNHVLLTCRNAVTVNPPPFEKKCM